MNSVTSLCTRCVQLADGALVRSGPPAEVVERYIEEALPERASSRDLADLPRPGHLARQARLTRIAIQAPENLLRFNDPLVVELTARAEADLEDLFFGIGVNTPTGIRLFSVEGDRNPVSQVKRGEFATVRATIPTPAMPPGTYTLTVAINAGTNLGVDHIPDALVFDIAARPEESLYSERAGLGLRPYSEWQSLF